MTPRAKRAEKPRRLLGKSSSKPMDGELVKLASSLRYHFSDWTLLEKALTHRSAQGAHGHNQRLEFLGDSVLNLLIGHELLKRNPSASEGQLTRMRAHLVNNSTLAGLAKNLGLGDRLKVGKSQSQSPLPDKMLGDALEALLGAVYADGGLSSAQQLVKRLYEPWFSQDPEERLLHQDPKTQLQEWCQSRNQPLPQYQLVQIEGQPPLQCFTVECRLPEQMSPNLVQSSGRNKKQAEQKAAATLLSMLTSPPRRPWVMIYDE